MGRGRWKRSEHLHLRTFAYLVEQVLHTGAGRSLPEMPGVCESRSLLVLMASKNDSEYFTFRTSIKEMKRTHQDSAVLSRKPKASCSQSISLSWETESKLWGFVELLATWPFAQHLGSATGRLRETEVRR